MPRDYLDNLTDRVSFKYGVCYIKTQTGISALNKLAENDYIDNYHDAGILLFLASMGLSLALLAIAALEVIITQPSPGAEQNPANYVAIPGVNKFLPLSAAVYVFIALVIAAAIHEYGHGLAMRAEDVPIEEIGIATITIIPIAAYVLPDEEAYESVGARAKARILCGGVTANILLFIVLTALFLVPGTGSAIEAFETYFAAFETGNFPTGGDVHSLGVVTNLLFWTWFFSVNLAFVNALPVMFLDGGQLVRTIPSIRRIPQSQDGKLETIYVSVSTLVTVSLFLFVVLAPLVITRI